MGACGFALIAAAANALLAFAAMSRLENLGAEESRALLGACSVWVELVADLGMPACYTNRRIFPPSAGTRADLGVGERAQHIGH